MRLLERIRIPTRESFSRLASSGRTLLWIGVGSLAFAPPARAQSYKLNDPISLRNEEGDVSGSLISPDGSWVVYMADQDVSEVAELYSALIDGSQPPVKLNGPLVQDGDVRIFEISPDSSRVVYVADQDTDGQRELYSVPIDGSAAPTKLNDPMVPGGDVTGLVGDYVQITSNGATVVYSADQDTDQSTSPIKTLTGSSNSTAYRSMGARALQVSPQMATSILDT